MVSSRGSRSSSPPPGRLCIHAGGIENARAVRPGPSHYVQRVSHTALDGRPRPPTSCTGIFVLDLDQPDGTSLSRLGRAEKPACRGRTPGRPVRSRPGLRPSVPRPPRWSVIAQGCRRGRGGLRPPRCTRPSRPSGFEGAIGGAPPRRYVTALQWDSDGPHLRGTATPLPRAPRRRRSRSAATSGPAEVPAGAVGRGPGRTPRKSPFSLDGLM